MRPADHPDFFRLAPPEGRSRESTIRLDAEGHFFHDEERVEHPGLAAAMHTWIARHPDDGRMILNNGYDWTYFKVDDVPYFVRAIRIEPERVMLCLSDETEEPWDPTTTRIAGDRIYAVVKRDAPGGPFDARFDRHAQTSLGALLEQENDQENGAFVARIGGATVRIGSAMT